MNKTKEAISSFMNKAGHHDTTVHEEVKPAVQHETVKPMHHEEVNTAIDREVHQDHYHHTVQPVKDREVLPEQHHHNIGETEHRQFDHRDNSKTKRALETEAAKFKNESRRVETTQTQSHAPIVQGEHVHHHVHETYQPVVHKETVEPHVVHTTVPIHEIHHNEAQHHTTSTLPAVNMSEFKKHGGTHTGGQHEHHAFDGCPDLSGEGHSHSHNSGIKNILHSGPTDTQNTNRARDTTTATHGSAGTREGEHGPHNSRIANALDPRVDSDRDHRAAKGSSNIGRSTQHGSTDNSTQNTRSMLDVGGGNYTTSGTRGNNLGAQGGSNSAAASAATAAFGSNKPRSMETDQAKQSHLGSSNGKSAVLEKINSTR